MSFYHNLIGVLIWIIKLGHTDIAFDVQYLSIYLAFTRTRHLVQALHILKYLEMHNTNNLDLYTCYKRVTSDYCIQNKVQAMKDFYVDAGEVTRKNKRENISGKLFCQL